MKLFLGLKTSKGHSPPPKVMSVLETECEIVWGYELLVAVECK